MKTTPYFRPLKVACLLLLSAALVNVGTAQVTVDYIQDNSTLWFHGADLTPGTLSSWAASKGNVTVSVGGGSTTPTVETLSSGLKYVQFNDSDRLLASGVNGGAFLSPTEGSLFIVLKPDGENPNGQTPFQIYGTDGTDRFGVQTEWEGDNTLYGQFGNGRVQVPPPTPEAGALKVAQPAGFQDNWHILSWIRQPGTTGDGILRLDGVELARGLLGTSVNLSSATVYIGAKDAPDNPHGPDTFQGAIAEIIVFDTAVDPQGVELYLGQKYEGLTPVPEPSEYALVFGVACVLGALIVRRRQRAAAQA